MGEEQAVSNGSNVPTRSRPYNVLGIAKIANQALEERKQNELWTKDG